MKKIKENSVILFLGDSLTDGGRHHSMDANHIMGSGYSYIISAKLGLDYHDKNLKFVNKGYDGFDSMMLHSRLYGHVVPNKPDYVSFFFGINDLNTSDDIPLGVATNRYIKTYENILDDMALLLPETEIIICEPIYMEVDNIEDTYENSPHVATCEPFFRPFNQPKNEKHVTYLKSEIAIMQKELKALAERRNLLFVPLQEEFNKVCVGKHAEYFVWDNIHPTIVGHQLIAKKWLDVVGKEIL